MRNKQRLQQSMAHSDLNQHQKDALKAQANGAQRVSNAQDVQHECD
ncbi:hypothetical protein UM590_03610 [Staphylococcus aureus]|nr:hypothetical protein UM590_03610 [Staphylococcus aureus]